ncbi:MAG: DUF1214 domain-containing protein [Halieaceae bacterium]|nr:DUF1214 domain-containing protein [Halieaceae bacterium]
MNIPEKWRSLKSTEAWRTFRNELDSVVEQMLEASRTELEVIDAYKMVLNTLAMASEVVLDPKPENPAFVRMDTPVRKTAGDNPDGEYDVAVIDGRYDYRIRGNKGTVSYVGFQVLAGGGMTPRRHAVNIKDEDIETDAEGNFELILGRERRDAEGEWVRIPEDASSIVVRQYVKDRARETLASYSLSTVESMDTLVPTDETFARQLLSTTWAMSNMSLLFKAPKKPNPDDYPNQLLNLNAEQAVAADTSADNMYMFCVYKLEPGQALQIDVEPPETRYWNFTVYNYWHECVDYMTQPVSLTNAHANYRADGSVRIVVSEQRPENFPESANWLSTLGRDRGYLVFRWMDRPCLKEGSARVVPVTNDFS